MELCAKACQKGLDLANQSGRSPGSEIAPMVFGVFPKNLDEIKFWAVGRQIEQEEFVVGLPALGEGGFNILMDRGIVQSQEGEFVGVRGFRQMVKEWNDVFSPDVVFIKLEMQFSLGVVQGSHGIDPLAAKAGVRRVGLAQRRPTALDIGQTGKPGFIEVEQFDGTFLRSLLKLTHDVLCTTEERLISFFLGKAGCA